MADRARCFVCAGIGHDAETGEICARCEGRGDLERGPRKIEGARFTMVEAIARIRPTEDDWRYFKQLCDLAGFKIMAWDRVAYDGAAPRRAAHG